MVRRQHLDFKSQMLIELLDVTSERYVTNRPALSWHRDVYDKRRWSLCSARPWAYTVHETIRTRRPSRDNGIPNICHRCMNSSIEVWHRCHRMFCVTNNYNHNQRYRGRNRWKPKFVITCTRSSHRKYKGWIPSTIVFPLIFVLNM